MDLREDRKKKKDWSEIPKYMLAGGVAGQASWVVAYPFDVIKTNIQTNLNSHSTLRQVSK